MEITFTHTGGGQDWVYVVRDDGTPLRWPWPSYGTELPYDLLHYVVETRLGIRNGFWGKVADGANFGKVSVAADQARSGDTADRPDPDLIGLIQVACVVVALHGGSDAERLRLARDACDRRGVPVPEGLDEPTLAGLRAEVDELSVRWQALAAGRSLVLPYQR